MMRILMIVAINFFVAGCASIVSGQDQMVSVTTPNCKGAQCSLTNPSGTYYVKAPGTVSVDREYGDLIVTCEKEGYDPFTMRVSSSTKGMAFGNILLGGIVGAGVDVATGAAYDYPTEIINPLDCRTEKEIAVAPKSGQYDDKAKLLVDLESCEEPSFVVRDGKQDIYKTRCVDGTVGVIGCSQDGCKPLNVASSVSQQSQKGEDNQLPKYAYEVQELGKAAGCSESFHASDVSSEGETWMAKCSNGKFMIIECALGKCQVQD